MTSQRRWRMFWMFVAATWIAAFLVRAKAEAMSVPAPGSSAFIKWCQNEASNTEYILWMCWMYVP